VGRKQHSATQVIFLSGIRPYNVNLVHPLVRQ